VSTLSPDRWREISPYLDQVLSLPEQERAAWIESFRDEKPNLVSLLQELLNEHSLVGREHFLEHGLIGPVNEQWLPGRKVGAYTLLSPIGEGGMGSVWLAERSDGRFERRVAIKFLKFAVAAQGGAERFKREGSILGRLAHPHIAELIDAGVTANGAPFLVLEHIDGERIDHYCDHRKLGVSARIALLLDVLSAVAQAHANLIVHRDIKPSNVLIRKDGQVKLLDFGIAKLLTDDTSPAAPTVLTAECGGALTLQFAAPEQVTNGAVTTATDVYSLGVLLYLLLTEQHPAGPGSHSPADLVKAIVEIEPPRASDAIASADAMTIANQRGTTPEKLHRQLRGDLDTIVGKALKKQPQERYYSVSAFADDLRHYLNHEPILAHPDKLAYRAAKFVRRNRTGVVFSVLAVIASIVGIAGTLIQARTARRQRDFAFRQLSRAETISDLEDFLLADAAPSGKPFTVNDLLARAEHIVAREDDPNGDNRVELLISIGRQYWGQDEDVKSRAVLEQAYQLSRGLSDHSVRSRASCALASAIARTGDPARAEALFEEGLREIPREAQFALDRMYCLLRGTEVADHNGASQEGIARALEAQRVLRNSAFNSLVLEWRANMELAEAYREAGQYREAFEAFQQSSILMARLGRDDTESAGTLYNNWALTLDSSGQPLEAEKIFHRAIEISRDNQGDQAVSPMLLVNYSRVLRRLGRSSEAGHYSERAYSSAQKAGDQVVVNQALLERARDYREEGDLARSTAMLDEVEPQLRRNLPAGHYAFAALASERALNALASGDLRAASELTKQAMAIAEAAMRNGKQAAQFLPILLLRRSSLELQLRDFDGAAADESKALDLLRSSTQSGIYSCEVGLNYLNLGKALQGQAKPDEARAAFRSAAEQLEKTLGPDHPDSRTARELAATTSN
jgi:eukaryotic-like serine/threonine-protein kinase